MPFGCSVCSPWFADEEHEPWVAMIFFMAAAIAARHRDFTIQDRLGRIEVEQLNEEVEEQEVECVIGIGVGEGGAEEDQGFQHALLHR